MLNQLISQRPRKIEELLHLIYFLYLSGEWTQTVQRKRDHEPRIIKEFTEAIPGSGVTAPGMNLGLPMGMGKPRISIGASPNARTSFGELSRIHARTSFEATPPRWFDDQFDPNMNENSFRASRGGDKQNYFDIKEQGIWGRGSRYMDSEDVAPKNFADERPLPTFAKSSTLPNFQASNLQNREDPRHWDPNLAQNSGVFPGVQVVEQQKVQSRPVAEKKSNVLSAELPDKNFQPPTQKKTFLKRKEKYDPMKAAKKDPTKGTKKPGYYIYIYIYNIYIYIMYLGA